MAMRRWLRIGPVLMVLAASTPARGATSIADEEEEEVPATDYEPLSPENQAAFPPAEAGAYPEEINVVSGYDEAQKQDWADGQGYVRAPIADVWAALQDKDVVADRRELKSVTVLNNNADSGADASFLLRCVTNSDPSITYQQRWRGRVTRGSADAPITVVMRDDLAQPATFIGIKAITTLSDSIVLQSVDANTTSISVIRHVVAAQSHPDRAERYVKDLFGSVVASVHGEALPKY